MENNDNNILIYQDDDGTTKVNVRFADEDAWLTQAQLAEIYNTSQENKIRIAENRISHLQRRGVSPRAN